MFKLYVTLAEIDGNGISHKNICEKCTVPSQNLASLSIKELGDLIYGLTVNGAKTIEEVAERAKKSDN